MRRGTTECGRGLWLVAGCVTVQSVVAGALDAQQLWSVEEVVTQPASPIVVDNLRVESSSGKVRTHTNRLGETANAASDVSAFPCSPS